MSEVNGKSADPTDIPAAGPTITDADEALLHPRVEALHGPAARVIADEVAVSRQLAETRRAGRNHVHETQG